MNLLLLERSEEYTTFPAESSVYQHLTQVLKVVPGQLLETGVWQQKRGRSKVVSVDEQKLILHNQWFPKGGHPGYPLTLVISCCRPVQAKRILKEATALGVRKMVWLISDHTTRSYAQSSLWQQENWMSEIREGASHAFTNMGPKVHPPVPLKDYLGLSGHQNPIRIALDNYEASHSLTTLCQTKDCRRGIELWVGPERGWSARERQEFFRHDIALAHLGCRVLKTEIACIAAIAQTLPLFPELYLPHAEFETQLTGQAPRQPLTRNSEEASQIQSG